MTMMIGMIWKIPYRPILQGRRPLMFEVTRVKEPKLRFGLGQAVEDARDGLSLFGPIDGSAVGVRAGVIGTPEGIRRFKEWAASVQQPVRPLSDEIAHPMFPGFETVYGIPWNPNNALEVPLDAEALKKRYSLADGHKRVFDTVAFYADAILEARQEEERVADIWFVVIPQEVYLYCRPNSVVPSSDRVKDDSAIRMSEKEAKKYRGAPPLPLFDELIPAAETYLFEKNFHNQLKARLLKDKVITQIIREPTLTPFEFKEPSERQRKIILNQRPAVAWNLCNAAYYKLGHRPWKIDTMREGVCYIGLVFKRDDRNPDPKAACCAAQMFLDSGDGMVFKGANGPWYQQNKYNPDWSNFHLSRKAARMLIEEAVRTYEKTMHVTPKEIFIHGRVAFGPEEWAGFQEGVKPETNIVGVKIQLHKDFKLYRLGKQPVLRGLAFIESERKAFLWSSGFVPRIQTYPGREVPNPLLVEIVRGSADIKTVVTDVLALTKLNYNTCIFADGNPVTLKFADAVGEILTAAPIETMPPLPFRHYI
jgi:hypothetical protein